MKNNLFLSIIIPCYNSESYIGNCLQCLSDQQAEDVEVIFVDDGSQDKTVEILNQFIYPHKKIITTEHAGPSEARNIGVKNAEGKYIWFVDSDDIFLTGAIKKIKEKLKESDADVLRFRYQIKEDDQIKIMKPVFKAGIYTDRNLFEIQRYAVGYADASTFFLWIHVYRKSLIENVPLLSLWEYLSESNSFNQRIYPRIQKLQAIDDVLYQYNIRPGSASFVHRPILDKTINLYRALKSDFETLGIYEKYKDMVAYCIVDCLMLGFCQPKRGAFLTEYAFCSNIETAHQRIQEIMDSDEFIEVVKEASSLKSSPMMTIAHKVLLERNEEKLFLFLRNRM